MKGKSPLKRNVSIGDVASETARNLLKDGKEKKKTSIELPILLWSEAKVIAVREDMDLRDIIIDALEKWVLDWQRRKYK